MTYPQETEAPLNESVVADLERRRQAALVGADCQALRELVAEDCAYVHSTGGVETGASYVAQFAAGTFGYEALAVEEVSITIAGFAAIVVYRQTADMLIGGERHVSRARCSATWVHHGGRTRLMAFQSTPLKGSITSTTKAGADDTHAT